MQKAKGQMRCSSAQPVILPLGQQQESGANDGLVIVALIR